MRTAPSTLLISVAALTLACAPAAEMPEDTTADVAAIEAVRAQEVAAITSGDTSLAYLTDDAVVMPPGAPQVAGKAALRNWMREFMAAVTIQAATYDQSTITVAGDWAIEHYTGTVTMMPASGGAAMTESMKGIHVYRRGADGTWKMAMDVWNTDSAPPGM
ncbi:MAG TPA: nuclear transport factor 2 family protein [Gemmatimonadales bacterium]|jgi:ketosteroid isomerase-like protein